MVTEGERKGHEVGVSNGVRMGGAEVERVVSKSELLTSPLFKKLRDDLAPEMHKTEGEID